MKYNWRLSEPIVQLYIRDAHIHVLTYSVYKNLINYTCMQNRIILIYIFFGLIR